MATTTQRLEIDLIVDSKGAITGLKKFNKAVDGTDKNIKETQKTMQKSESGLKKFKAGWLAVAGAVVGVTKVFSIGIKKASEFQEVNAKFGTVFRGVEKQAEAMAKELESAYGLSVIESRKFLSSTQDLLVPMGLSREAAAQFSSEVAKLSVDLGSFNNMPTAQVMADIQSALVGNFETTKKYGVVLNETAIKQRIFEDTGVKVKGVVDAQTKALTALKLIQEGSADAQGDFIRTQESFANQSKVLSSNLENLGVALGQKILPFLTPIISKFNEWLTPEKDLTSLTMDLIKLQGQHSDVVKKLEKARKDNNKQAEREANLDKELIEIKIVEKIRDISLRYKELQSNQKRVNQENELFKTRSEKLTDVLLEQEGDIIKLDKATRDYLKTAGFWLRAEESREKVSRTASILAKGSNESRIEAIKLTQDESSAVDIYAKTLKGRSDIEQKLVLLTKGFADVIREKIKLLEEDTEKTNDNTNAKDENNGVTEKAKANLEAFNQYIQESREAEMSERELAIERENQAYDQALLNLKDNLDKKLISQKEYNIKVEQLNKQHEYNKNKIYTEGVGKITKVEAERREKSEENAQAFRDAWNTAIGQTVSNYAQGITEMIFAGEMWRKNFIDFMKDMIIALGKMIVQLLITKAIMASLGGIGLIFEDGGLVPKAEDGGLLSGASHAQGGVNVEAEGGEYIVSKKNVTSETLPLLHAINNGFKGTSKMAVANSPYTGYANGGMVDNSNNSKSSVVTIENINIPETDPRELLNGLVEAGDDMGINLINRGQA